MVASIALRSRVLFIGVVAAALLVAGCGVTTPSAVRASPSPSLAAIPSPSPVTTNATIAVKAVAKLGNILVDRRGEPLYLFEADTGKDSTCYEYCEQFWPPVLTAGAPHAGAGAKASLLGTTTRTDGTSQVTYAGHPLYYFYTDSPGEAHGQGINGFGGRWWVVSPSGAAITTS
jgi:predicted lipoprotein with Yx(FWY)xxD motif